MPLHVVIFDQAPFVDVNAVQNMLNVQAVNYYRFAQGSWVVVSHHDAQTWYALLQPFVPQNGYVFICLLNPYDKQGWMPQKFWAWFNQHQFD